MRVMVRACAALVLIGGFVVTADVAQAAPVDCQYTKSKKLVTLSIDNADSTGWLIIERQLGTKRIGYTVQGDTWKGCEGARTTTTNKVKVMGSTLSEDLYIDTGNGAFAPGAAEERTGKSEIEFVLALGDGTDGVTLVGGPQRDKFGFAAATKGHMNADGDVDITMTGADLWELIGYEGNDILNGSGAPEVTVAGGSGEDLLLGGDGSDSLYGDENGQPGGDDWLLGGEGDDSLYGYLGNDALYGRGGDDYLAGHEGRDLLDGSEGDDYFESMATKDGADTFVGGSGYDTVNYSARSARLKISLDSEANDGGKKERDGIGSSVERVNAGDGNDSLVGNGQPNDLNGGGGDDEIRGLDGGDDLDGDDGNDRLFGGPGDEFFSSEAGLDRFVGGEGNDNMWAGTTADGRDVYSGGPGRDQIDYSNRVGALFIDVTVPDGDGDVATDEYDNIYPDFERIYGGSGSDVIRGGNNAEYLNGGSGTSADLISGRGGADNMYGNDGDDHLIGGEGLDYINGGNDDDEVEAEDFGEDQIDCAAGAGDIVLSMDVFDDADNCETLPV